MNIWEIAFILEERQKLSRREPSSWIPERRSGTSLCIEHTGYPRLHDNLLNATRFLFVVAFIALIAIASPVAAQNDCGLDNWDEDGDGTLSDDEFETAIVEVGYYDDWDEDIDGT